MPRLPNLHLTVLLLVLHTTCALAATNQFQRWYGEFGLSFKTILRNNCTKQYDTYLTGVLNNSATDTVNGADPTNQLAEPVVNCILSFTSEFIKSAMASAQVLLGLTPTMLAVLGPSTEETSLLFVVGRRPLLALCLAAGCPAVFPMRSFDNQNPVGLLEEREGRLRPPHVAGAREMIVMLLQYSLTIMAIANVATLSKELGLQVVCNFAPHLTYLVSLWAFLILIIHTSGAITLMFRVRLTDDEQPSNRFEWISRQFTPLSKRGLVRVRLIPESYMFTFFSWFTAILTVCHVIYGTLVFSSMLFISVRDSLTVIARYMASVIVCRTILMYELASLRTSFNLPPATSSEVELREGFPKYSRVGGTTSSSVHDLGSGQVHTW